VSGHFGIEKVRNYLQSTVINDFPWIYWLAPDSLWVGYQLLLTCTCSSTISNVQDKKKLVEFNNLELSSWLEKQFYNLNAFTEKNGIPIEINKEISDNLFRFLETKAYDIR